MELEQKIIRESEKNFNITLGTNPGIGNLRVDLIRITLDLKGGKVIYGPEAKRYL
jgi:hypothetical protein